MSKPQMKSYVVSFPDYFYMVFHIGDAEFRFELTRPEAERLQNELAAHLVRQHVTRKRRK